MFYNRIFLKNVGFRAASFFLIAFSQAHFVFGQAPSVDDGELNKKAVFLRNAVVFHDLAGQIGISRIATVRAYARLRLATWYLRESSSADDATRMAGMAIEDLYKNRDEVPNVYFTSIEPELFDILKQNSPDQYKKLRSKFNNPEKTLDLDILLRQLNGDRKATDAAISSSQDQISSEVISLAWQLDEMASPELPRLLTFILGVEERNVGRISLTLQMTTPLYLKQNGQILERFLRLGLLVADRSLRSMDDDHSRSLSLLGQILPLISEKYPDLHGAASAAYSALSLRVSRQANEELERNKRIAESGDRLEALISEAEKATDPTLKYSLMIEAARYALRAKKFTNSLKLLSEAEEIEKSADIRIFTPEKRSMHLDQILADLTQASLADSQVNVAEKAVKKILDPFRKVDSLKELVKFHKDANDLTGANGVLTECEAILNKSSDNTKVAVAYINLILVAQSLDRNRVYEINKRINKSINSIQSIKAAESSESAEYKQYVTSLMIVNWNLFSTVKRLVKLDPALSDDLVNQIDNSNIKLIAAIANLTGASSSNSKMKNNNNNGGTK
ncbi:MAG: hypothetical protein ABL999_01275 [Pyrinomonadaceae bacterium]